MNTVKLKIAEGVHIPFNKDLMLYIMLCIAWSPILLKYLRGVYTRLPFIGEDRVDLAIIATVALSVIASLPTLINRFSIIDYIFYTLNVFYILACYVFFPENKAYLDENALVCIFCVFTYYFVGRTIELERLWNVLVFLSAICIFANVFYYFILSPINKVASEVMGNDNMNAAYSALPHVALILWSTMERFRLWKVFVLLVGSMFLLSCGTRGPFLCMGIFGIIYFFFYMNFKGAIYVKTGIITAFALLIATLNTTLYYIAFLFTNLNLSTRILEHLVTGELGNYSSRSILREKLEYIMDNSDHFWGLGAFGCRNYNIIYPHFLPLDFAVTYGYVLGYFLLFLVTALILYSLWISRGTKRQIFIIYMISISIIKLMLSNTFLLEPYFYMLIGVCASEILINHETDNVSIRDAARSNQNGAFGQGTAEASQ